jgi:hypothetical protein
LNQHRHWRKEAGDDRLDKETRKSPRCAAAAASGSLVREQRREFDQVMLRAAAANALVFGGERSEHLDVAEKSARSNAAKPRDGVGR